MSMAHGRFEFEMPASEAVVFDAFHFHHWRCRWDSLVRATRVLDGSPCPYKGAITENGGAGYLRLLSMRTQFVIFERPHVAAAKMIDQSFPFKSWAASMRHRPMSQGRSLMVYTYTFVAGSSGLQWCIEPLVKKSFEAQTLRRFGRLQKFLAEHAAEIEAWQCGQ